MLNRELIDQEYGYLNDVVYIDTSKTSVPPMRVQKAWKNFIDGYVQCYALNYGTYFDEKLTAAKKELAKLLSVDPEEIAFTGSAAAGMTILANSLSLKAGDSVVITNEEHASNAIPWLAQERFGVKVKIVESRNGWVEAEDIISAIDETTKVVSIASSFFCSGYEMDLKTIGAACEQKGVLFAVDATQSVGRLIVRPREFKADYVVGGGHKGLLGTKSVGFVYCSRKLVKKLQPYTGSLQGQTNGGRPFRLAHYDEILWKDTAEKLEFGNYPFATIEAAGIGAGLLNELGIDNIDAHVRRLDHLMRERLKEVALRYRDTPEGHRSGTFYVYYPEKADPKKVEEVLWAHRIRATVRYDYIRFTFDFFNTEEQIDRIVETLKAVAEL